MITRSTSSHRRSTRGEITGLLLLLLFASGCERGCLARALEERTKPASSSTRGGLDLGGTDCSDGLLRCQQGRVEASRAAHLAHPCERQEQRDKACACPWDEVETCARGCADERLEVAASPDAGAQLCRPALPVARPVLPSDPAPVTVCASDDIACEGGLVRVCDQAGQTARWVAFCFHGCAPHVRIDHDGLTMDPDGLGSILCRRNHAERN